MKTITLTVSDDAKITVDGVEYVPLSGLTVNLFIAGLLPISVNC